MAGTPAPAPPPLLPTNQAKSSLKMKSKVADSGRSKVDLTASSSLAPALAPAPESSVSLASASLPAAQLQVEKLPVFNFTPAASPLAAPFPPLKQNTEKPSAEVKPSSPLAHSVASVSPIPPEVLERNNNDKSPNKRLINEAEDQLSSSEKKKVKNVEVTGLVSQEAGAADIIPREDLARAFSFSQPQSVIESSEIEAVTVTEAPRSYIFRTPSHVEAGGNSEIKKLFNGPTKSSNSGVR